MVEYNCLASTVESTHTHTLSPYAPTFAIPHMVFATRHSMIILQANTAHGISHKSTDILHVHRRSPTNTADTNAHTATSEHTAHHRMRCGLAGYQFHRSKTMTELEMRRNIHPESDDTFLIIWRLICTFYVDI